MREAETESEREAVSANDGRRLSYRKTDKAKVGLYSWRQGRYASSTSMGASMTRQLNVRNDEAYELAHKIARSVDRPVTQVVLEALRAYGSEIPAEDGMTPSQRASYEALMALAKEAGKHKKPGATSDHRDMYDDFGLPI